MAIFEDPLLREEDPLDPERGSRGFGLRLFKSAEEAYRNDVVQRSPAPPATPDQAAYQALFAGGGGGGSATPAGMTADQAAYQALFGGGAPQAKPAEERGNFSRGL